MTLSPSLFNSVLEILTSVIGQDKTIKIKKWKIPFPTKRNQGSSEKQLIPGLERDRIG